MSAGYSFEPSNFYQFRVIIIGDSTVGKSSLLRQFVEGKFNQSPDPTVGVDFHIRTIKLHDEVQVKLQLWDTAGQERFRAITRSYYRNCAGCIIMYDLTNRDSFEHVANWFEESKSAIDDQDIVFMLIGHKVDLDYNRQVLTSEGEAFARAHNMLFIETSAKVLCNIEEAFVLIASEIYGRLEGGRIRQKSGWDGIKTVPFRPGNVYLTDYQYTAPPESEGKCYKC